MYKSWLNTLPDTFNEADHINIDKLYEWIMDPLLIKLRKKFSEISPTINQNLVVSHLRLFKALLMEISDKKTYETL